MTMVTRAAAKTQPQPPRLRPKARPRSLSTGPERDESEVGGIQAGLDVWGAENGVEVTYIGDADWEANVNTQVEGGNPPDISFFPQPGKLAGFARDGVLKPLNDDAAAATAANWPDAWNAFGERRRSPVRRARLSQPEVSRLVPARQV